MLVRIERLDIVAGGGIRYGEPFSRQILTEEPGAAGIAAAWFRAYPCRDDLGVHGGENRGQHAQIQRFISQGKAQVGDDIVTGSIGARVEFDDAPGDHFGASRTRDEIAFRAADFAVRTPSAATYGPT